jgi:hypothetical protein
MPLSESVHDLIVLAGVIKNWKLPLLVTQVGQERYQQRAHRLSNKQQTRLKYMTVTWGLTVCTCTVRP